ncbi:SRPBCC domain-containing protein [Kitasatospora sp. NPDC059747]|uniref:SRPBCC family protein n=1 Tax=Kitasatospora sp. NPDC059747 TaxID=3346930 RepID=UPI003657F59B
MTHPFEIALDTVLPAGPEQVWEAIATGPGVDSWFMGRNTVDPREGGTAAMTTAGHRQEAVVTAWEPAKRLATRTPETGDGRFMAFEYLIEGREGAATVLRVVHSGVLGDDWQEEYDALRRGWPFHLYTLHEYLAHFAHRTAVPVFAAAPAPGRTPQEIRALLAGALGLPLPVTEGARARADVPGLPPLQGHVVWADDERIAVRGTDALHTFHHGPGLVLLFHHLFHPTTDGPATDGADAATEIGTEADRADAAWQQWLTRLLA